MKFGHGFYRHHPNRQDYDFARQCGATHAIVHLTDYFNKGEAGRKTGRSAVSTAGATPAATGMSMPRW